MREAGRQETAPEPAGECPLCGRPMLSGPSIDAHHLVPKSRKGRVTVTIHRICHEAIHAALSDKEIAARYNTVETLRAHPEIARFIGWVRGRPPEFTAPTKGLRERGSKARGSDRRR